MRSRIIAELKKHGAVKPTSTIDPDLIQRSLGVAPADFLKVLSELTDFEKVGMISGEIYLRTEVVHAN